MELRLRPLADDELAAYIEASRAGYLSDLVEHARFPPAFAVEKADRDLALLEEEVRARGIGEIALNVWGGNDVARSLYRSEGYFERAVEMAKELA